MAGFWDRRLVAVLGKGGVGRSTVAAAVALSAARAGKNVLVCEVGHAERVSALLGSGPVGPRIGPVAERVEAVHVLPHEAMREYGLMVLKFKAIYEAVFENRLVRYFLNAVPSLSELVVLGKVLYHVNETGPGDRPRWDMVVLDAPATGHALSLLRLPQVLIDTVPPGPLARDARWMRDLLVDAERTTALLVTLPEEMPVNEAIEIDRALRDVVRVHRSAAVLNRFVPPRFSPAEREALAKDPFERHPAAAAAAAHCARAEMCARYLAKLNVEIELPVVRVRDAPAEPFGRSQVEEVSRILEEAT